MTDIHEYIENAMPTYYINQFFISHSLDVQTEIKLLNGLYYTHCSTFGGV